MCSRTPLSVKLESKMTNKTVFAIRILPEIHLDSSPIESDFCYLTQTSVVSTKIIFFYLQPPIRNEEGNLMCFYFRFLSNKFASQTLNGQTGCKQCSVDSKYLCGVINHTRTFCLSECNETWYVVCQMSPIQFLQ